MKDYKLLRPCVSNAGKILTDIKVKLLNIKSLTTNKEARKQRNVS